MSSGRVTGALGPKAGRRALPPAPGHSTAGPRCRQTWASDA
ncbi:hypothetical protein N7U49_17810 [Streptomyces sp. AD2-2]|nr:hypothetical protein N7U49_17810 [Streptomyces sp. AD2-2]